MRSSWRRGLTSLILCQGILNIFVVLGLAPLTGVPLPFISYAPTNLLRDARVGRAAAEHRAAAGTALRAVDGRDAAATPVSRDGAADRDRRRRDRGARGAGAGGRRRAAS